MTHRRALGSFLGGQPALPPPAPPKRQTDTDRVRAALEREPARWFSAVELAEETGVSDSHVNGTVYALITRGLVERQRTDGRRRHGQRYRWVSR